MKLALLVLPCLLLVPAPSGAREVATSDLHPEAQPFDAQADAAAEVTAALARASASGHAVILVFGANWCHDSRALAGWFTTDRFRPMLATRYEVVWIDVGQRDRNIDLARHFGLDGITGTPTVLVVDSEGKPRNLRSAGGWKNASRRRADDIYHYFEAGPQEE